MQGLIRDFKADNRDLLSRMAEIRLHLNQKQYHGLTERQLHEELAAKVKEESAILMEKWVIATCPLNHWQQSSPEDSALHIKHLEEL
eukprot:17581-Rhodomonas_salina.1